jgi:D-beta-D-heptose 7-phosphate kinase/D-beta-D-heptose 1-phosphate adenosyltransferase
MTDIIDKIPKARVLCVGDLMIDRFVQGDVERISPEAPVPVFRWSSEKQMLGGVGNVVANVKSLGASAAVAARIGRDTDGETATALLARHGAETLLISSNAVPTIQKTRFVAQGNHVMRMDREMIAPLAPEEETELLSKISARLNDFDIVILSDYAKGLVSPSFSAALINACRAASVPVYVDPKGCDYSKYAGATLVKPNRKELEAVCGVKFNPAAPDFTDQIVSCARNLISDTKIEKIVVTLSERGMVFVPDDGGEPVFVAAKVREVSDVSGAGDTTMAALAVARAAGATFCEAMAIANAAAGIVVGKVGTATVSPAELKNALVHGHSETMPFADKIMSPDELASKTLAWQKEGLRVGFTNGCFDCLHCGHLSSLYQAKEHCDRLVVAVNSDASVRRLKGASRPIQDERTRTLVLAGLELVDAVVVFDYDTALPVVEKIRPDVIAKEGYSIDKWPEGRFVESYGGKAVFLKRVDGYSTSALANRMGAK